MSSDFSWNCPYCKRDTTITEKNYSTSNHYFNHNNKAGTLAIVTYVVTCPNPDCKEFSISAELFKTKLINTPYTERFLDGKPITKWHLRPNSFAVQLPDYIPSQIKSDYEEACLIRDLSPKASATLSRRCLQGIIRDYWQISKNRLIDEIQALKEKIDPLTWNAINSVRSIGNIGAHMEKDINLIIDVDSNEAQLLIGLIEILIKDWYIARHERQKHFEKIIDVAKEKNESKK